MSRVKTSQQFSVYFFVNIKKIVINIKNSNLVFVCVLYLEGDWETRRR